MKRDHVSMAGLLLAAALLPALPTPACWISLPDHIGLYALAAIGLVLPTRARA